MRKRMLLLKSELSGRLTIMYLSIIRICVLYFFSDQQISCYARLHILGPLGRGAEALPAELL